jgi:P27 family predicted phage terminase small subunit
MGKRGPAPKPTKLKILEGNPGKGALPKNEPEPSCEGVVKPEWLDDLGGAEWDKVAPELARLGLLTDLDVTALALYCQSVSMAIRADREVQKGLLHKTPNGHIQPSPYVSILRGADERARRYMREFGLTPAARVGLATDKQSAADEFSQYLAEQAKGG